MANAMVRVFTAARMLAIEAQAIISGAVVNNNLILTRNNGQTVDAGNVRGPQGLQGIQGIQGIQGVKGDQGIQGVIGPVGPGVNTGMLAMWPTAAPPAGFLICDGSERPVATYPDLNALLGTLYGARTNGSGQAGTTHFRLPDFRGRTPLGVGTAVPAVAGGTAHTLAEKGGEEKHTMLVNELAQHTHAIPGGNPPGASSTTDTVQRSTSAGDTNFRTSGVASGSGYGSALHNGTPAPFNVLNPFLGINFIIKT